MVRILRLNWIYRCQLRKFCYRTMDELLPPSNVKGAMDTARTAGIIIIGDEVLKGQVEDKNLPYLAKKLANLGIRLCKVSVIPDSVEDVAKEISHFSSKFDRVITTGGIGPTHDDVTYEGLAEAFNDKLVLNKEMADFWTWFNNDIDGKARNSTLKMATVPSNATVLYPELQKHISSRKFPVVTLNNVCVFPGIPYYVKAIFEGLEGTYFVNSGIRSYIKRIYLNVWESVVTESLNDAVSKFKDVTFGSYPKVNCPYYKVVMTIESTKENNVQEAFEYLRSKILDEFITDEGGALGDAWLNVEEGLAVDRFGKFSKNLIESVELLEKIFEEHSNQEVFLAFNGGKDCTALLHLVHTVLNKKYGLAEYPKLTALYIKTSHPFKEVEDFIEASAQRYRLNLIVHNGPIKEALQELSLEEPGKRWKIALMGTRRNDPHGEHLQPIQKTDEGWANLLRVSPLLEWTYADVWTFLKMLNVPYCKLYDQGYTSLDQSTNTTRNPALLYIDEFGNEAFHPAYKLTDESDERKGRE